MRGAVGSDELLEPPAATSILLVDDHPANLLVLEAILAPLGQRLVRASSGEEALARLREEEFAVVLLDVMMPGMDGLSTADLARAQARGHEVPIILMTAGDTPALEGYAHGAVDVVRKPLDRALVLAKVTVFIDLFRARELVRRQAAQELVQRAQQETAAILAAVGDGICGLDAQGRTTFINAAASRILGRGSEALQGQFQHDLVHPRRPDGSPYPRQECPIHQTSADGGMPHSGEEVFWREDGTSFPVEYTRTPLPGGTGLTHAVVVFRDISERKRAEAAQAFLAQASEALASSLEYEVTLETVSRLAVPHVADWCAIEIVNDPRSGPARLAVAHMDPAKVALAEELRRRYPPNPDAQHGVPQVLRSGRSELYEDVPDSLLERAATDAEHLRILRALGIRSAMTVPIAARGQTVGAITFVAAESGRRYGPSDLIHAQELARRASIAIENSRLYRATQRAEARNRFLAEVTQALASSLDYTTTLARVARLAVPTIADSAAVYRLDDDGGIRLLALSDANPAREALGRELDALLPLQIDQDRLLPRVVRSGRAELVAELPEALRETWSPTTRAGQLVRELAILSYMVVPLVVQGRVLGAVALTAYESNRRFGPTDLELAEELARRAGQAIENARLYREVQEANRTKDEFLATVSHELRTPLTAMLGWLHLLRSDNAKQVARAVETIERNARAQTRIVDDLLDVSRIITGKLRLEREPVDLAELVRATVDTTQPAADAKGVELVVQLEPSLGKLLGDAARLQQVLWNLFSNAIKFTPRAGRVVVQLGSSNSSVFVRVSDTGQGIPADFLPHVFERFRQANSTPTRSHGGLGLGLAIVRHLVELHGGYVSAESEGEGRGATFTVVLPVGAAE